MPQYRHPHPAVTVDVTAFTTASGRLQVLALERDQAPFAGQLALPGGFVGISEPLADAAVRVLRDKARIEHLHLEQLYTFGAPDRDPRERVISVAYLAVMPKAQPLDPAGQWVDALQPPALAFDHHHILATAIERMRAKLDYSTIGLRFLPPEFTLSALQHTYEIVLDQALDKRNFRKQMLASGRIEPTGATLRSGAHRPAKAYRVASTSG